MTVSESKTAPNKRKRRVQNPNRPVQYVIAIDNWEWSFSFGVNKLRQFDDPYSDYRHLQISGPLKRPEKSKVTTASATLLPAIRLNESERQKDQPQHVGSIDARGSNFSALLSIPADALPSIIAAFHSGQFRYLVMEGEKLRYGHGLVTDFRLDRMVDYDDKP